MSQTGAQTDDLFEVASVPIVDAHCHPMRPVGERLSVDTFERKISLSFMPHNQPDRARRPQVRAWPAGTLPRPTLMLTYLYRGLADFLGVPPEPERVIAAREERAQDFSGYVQALFKDAGIAMLVADSGYPGPVPCREFAEVARVPVWEIVRIDSVMEQIARTTDDFAAFMDAYRTRLDEALRQPGCVGLKSVIAYITGLEIGPENPAQAEAQFPAFRQDPFRRDFKALRDLCVREGLKLCLAHNKPMQFHSGFGDDDIYFTRSAARYMYELLAYPPFSDCLVVLVHGGHPWSAEAGIMAGLLPNVYLDISQANPFFSYGVADMLWEVLQVAPLSKVMYGSDAFHLPELYWLGAKIGRYAVREVLGRLLAAGWITAGEGKEMARQILHDNAVALYELAE